MPAFARLFLRAARRDVEVRQYAQSLFLTRGLFGTRDRTAVLILISLFERRIEILPDVGLHGRVSETDWQTVIARMTPHLRGSLSGRNWVFSWDARRHVGYLLAIPRAGDRKELGFDIEWR